jgi:hypothetical protein
MLEAEISPVVLYAVFRIWIQDFRFAESGSIPYPDPGLKQNLEKPSVPDPGSGAVLAAGSGMGKKSRSGSSFRELKKFFFWVKYN